MSENNDLRLEIDPDRLDQEWVDQPRLFHQYAVKLANARAGLDEANASLGLKKAELSVAIRETPSEFGFEGEKKPTEAAITAKITLGITEEVDAVTFASQRVEIYQAAVKALDQRRAALENMVKLRLADYYSAPKAPDGVMEEIEQKLTRQRGVRERPAKR